MDMNPCKAEAFGFIIINPGDSTFLMREAPAELVDFKNIRDMEALRERRRKRRSGSKPHKSFIREA